MQVKMAAAITVLLVILAALQYRWTGQMSRAEHREIQLLLGEIVNEFGRAFDKEITRAYLHFRFSIPRRPGSSEQHFYQKWASWPEVSPYPELLRALYFVRENDTGDLELSKADPAAQRSDSVHWDEGFNALKTSLEAIEPQTWPLHGGAVTEPILIDDTQAPLLVLPLPPRRSRGPFFQETQASANLRCILIRLDVAYLEQTFLPLMIKRYFERTDNRPIYLQIKDKNGRMVFRSPQLTSTQTMGDAQGSFLGLRRFEELEPMVMGPAREPGGRFRMRELLRNMRVLPFDPNAPPEGIWNIAVFYGDGSLTQTVARHRQVNLVIGFGVLSVLGLALFLTVFSSRKASRLARQQLAFVAGVSHELLTPLAGIRSAAQNLADDVVSERRQVRQYGTMIEKESKRLVDMVEKVLDFAGIQSQKRNYHFQELNLADLIRESLEDVQIALETQAFKVTVDLEEDLPTLRGDRKALKSVIHNLIGNALKYAPESRWLGIEARVVKGGEIRLSIEDRGPGIDKTDLPHIFEPFYRGRRVVASAISGSGLGLCVVAHIIHAHGGRIRAENLKQGARFSLSLPAQDPAPAKTSEEIQP